MSREETGANWQAKEQGLDPEILNTVDSWIKKTISGPLHYLAPFIQELEEAGRTSKLKRSDWGIHRWMIFARAKGSPHLAERMARLGMGNHPKLNSIDFSSSAWHQRISQIADVTLYEHYYYGDVEYNENRTRSRFELPSSSRENLVLGANLYWREGGELKEVTAFCVDDMATIGRKVKSVSRWDYIKSLDPAVYISSGIEFYSAYGKPRGWVDNQDYVVPKNDGRYTGRRSHEQVRQAMRRDVGEACKEARRKKPKESFSEKGFLPLEAVSAGRAIRLGLIECQVKKKPPKQTESSWVKAVEESEKKAELLKKAERTAASFREDNQEKSIFSEEVMEQAVESLFEAMKVLQDYKESHSEANPADTEKTSKKGSPPTLPQDPLPSGSTKDIEDVLETNRQAVLSAQIASLREELGLDSDDLSFRARSPIPGDPLDVIEAVSDPLRINEMNRLARLSEELDEIRRQKGLPPDREHGLSSTGLSNKIDNLGLDLGINLSSGGWDL